MGDLVFGADGTLFASSGDGTNVSPVDEGCWSQDCVDMFGASQVSDECNHSKVIGMRWVFEISKDGYLGWKTHTN